MKPSESAYNIINKYCLTSPSELNLVEILYAENLKLKEEPLNNCEGKIIFDEEMGIITLNSLIIDERQRRFTLAHEMGHFFNERESLKFYNKFLRQKYTCGFEEFYGKNRKYSREAEANEFAAEILMYKPWYQDFIRNKPINFELMKEAAEYFNVSLTAAVLRYVFIGQYPIALILSRDGKVVWSAVNEYFPYKFIPKDYKVSEKSGAYEYFIGKEVQTCVDVVPVYVWFSRDYNCESDKYLYEQNFVMYNYKCVLTMLWEYGVLG